MPRSNVVLHVSAKEANVLEPFLKVTRAMEEAERKAKKLGDSGKKGGNDMGMGFANAARSVGRTILQIAGLTSAMAVAHKAAQLVTRELEKQQKIRMEASDTQQGVGKALGLIAAGLPPDADITMKQILEAAKRSKSGNEIEQVLREVEAGISAGTSSKVSDRVAGAIAVGEMAKRIDPEARVELIGVSRQIAEAFPEETTQEQAAATILGAVGTSPGGMRNLQQFSQNIAGGAAQASAFGFSFEEAMPILLGMQNRSLDIEGATTRTNFINNLGILVKKFKEAGVQDAQNLGTGLLDFSTPHGKKIQQEMLGVFSSDLEELIGQPIDSTEHARELISQIDNADLSARAKGKVAMIELLQGGDNLTMQKIADARRQSVFGEEATRFQRQKERDLLQLPVMAADEANRNMQIFRNQMETDPAFAVPGQFIEALEQIRLKTGGTALGTSIEQFKAKLTTTDDPEQALEDFLDTARKRRKEIQGAPARRDRAAIRRRGTGPVDGSIVSPIGAEPITPSELTAVERREISSLRILESLLRRQLEVQGETLRAVNDANSRENNRDLRAREAKFAGEKD